MPNPFNRSMYQQCKSLQEVIIMSRKETNKSKAGFGTVVTRPVDKRELIKSPSVCMDQVQNIILKTRVAQLDSYKKLYGI